jgi:hypothetical protein
MDKSANLVFICPTFAAVFMSLIAECMHGFTVFLPCDSALLWIINFPLQLSPAQKAKANTTNGLF